MEQTKKISTNAPEINNDVQSETHKEKDWTFTFEKSRISTSTELDQMVDALKLQGIPDIVFGKNKFTMVYGPNNFTYRVNAADSLAYCNYEKVKNCFQETYDKTSKVDAINVIPAELKIKQSEFWKHKKVDDKTDVKVLEKISDWTYSTPYKGSVGPAEKKKDIGEITISLDNLSLNTADKSIQVPYLESTKDDINLANLGPSNPIKYYNEITLFEDELGDCGLSQSNFRFRVMGDCFFGLLRFYLRNDEVLIRIYDTRFYHEFGKDYILREFTWKEATYEQLKKSGFKFTADFHMDPKQSDIVYKDLETKYTFKDKLHFK
jgi:type 2A phosphatase activator TIP41